MDLTEDSLWRGTLQSANPRSVDRVVRNTCPVLSAGADQFPSNQQRSGPLRRDTGETGGQSDVRITCLYGSHSRCHLMSPKVQVDQESGRGAFMPCQIRHQNVDEIGIQGEQLHAHHEYSHHVYRPSWVRGTMATGP